MRQGTEEYWVCVIGPINSKDLPNGADAPPRTAAQNAVFKMTDCGTFECWSGWGRSKKQIERILKI